MYSKSHPKVICQRQLPKSTSKVTYQIQKLKVCNPKVIPKLIFKNHLKNKQIPHCVTKESSNTNPFFLEWQLWKGINRLNSSSNLSFDMKINDQKIIIDELDRGSSNAKKQVVSGLKYHVVKKWISQKILSIKLFLEVSTSNNTVINLPEWKKKTEKAFSLKTLNKKQLLQIYDNLTSDKWLPDIHSWKRVTRMPKFNQNYLIWANIHCLNIPAKYRLKSCVKTTVFQFLAESLLLTSLVSC